MHVRFGTPTKKMWGSLATDPQIPRTSVLQIRPEDSGSVAFNDV